MKFAWRQDMIDLAKWNSVGVEVVDLDEYSELLKGDEQAAEWDSGVTANEFILDD